MAGIIPDVLIGRFGEALATVWRSPVVGWNVLMGSWLYLIVAGLSYAIRGHQRLTGQAAAEAEARLLAERAQLPRSAHD
jgi:hypothetical protein